MSVFISSSGGIQHWFIRNVRKATQRHSLKTWTPFRVFPSTFKFLLSVLFHPDSLAAVCCCCCMSVTQGASVVSSTFIMQQTEHRTITDRAAIMLAECCTADCRIVSTAVYRCHLLPSFVTNNPWWLTYKRMLWIMADETMTRGKNVFGMWHSLLCHFLFLFPASASVLWGTCVCMYVCMYVYIYIYVCVCVCVCVCTGEEVILFLEHQFPNHLIEYLGTCRKNSTPMSLSLS